MSSGSENSIKWERIARWQILRNRTLYFLTVSLYFLLCEYLWWRVFISIHIYPVNYLLFVMQTLPNFFSAQYLGNTVIYKLGRISPLPRKIPDRRIRVAMLYCTKDDFLKDIAAILHRECEKTNWMDFWILDDSRNKRYISQVKNFTLTHRKAYRFRRGTNRGYKAGAINDWLREYGHFYDYLFIVDSDSIVVHQEVFKAVMIAEANPQFFAFQMKAFFYAMSPSTFEIAMLLVSKGISLNHVAFWRLGYGIFFGHNALIRTRDLIRIGGMVESSQEDIETLMRARTLGKKVAFLEDVYGYEAVPPDYLSFRIRTMRWTSNVAHSLGFFVKGGGILQKYFLLFVWMGFALTLFSVVNVIIVTVEIIVFGVNPVPGLVPAIAGGLLNMGIFSQLLVYGKEDLKYISKLAWGLLYSVNIGFTTIVSMITGIFRRVPFIVTPKEKHMFHLSDYRLELAFGLGILGISLFSPLALLMNWGWYMAPFILVLKSWRESRLYYESVVSTERLVLSVPPGKPRARILV